MSVIKIIPVLSNKNKNNKKGNQSLEFVFARDKKPEINPLPIQKFTPCLLHAIPLPSVHKTYTKTVKILVKGKKLPQESCTASI